MGQQNLYISFVLCARAVFYVMSPPTLLPIFFRPRESRVDSRHDKVKHSRNCDIACQQLP